jgi:hypothetical protein
MMLACLLSKQLGIRANCGLLNRAIVELDALLSSIDVIMHAYRRSRMPGNPLVALQARDLRKKIEGWKKRGNMMGRLLHERIVEGKAVMPRAVVPVKLVTRRYGDCAGWY